MDEKALEGYETTFEYHLCIVLLERCVQEHLLTTREKEGVLLLMKENYLKKEDKNA